MKEQKRGTVPPAPVVPPTFGGAKQSL